MMIAFISELLIFWECRYILEGPGWINITFKPIGIIIRQSQKEDTPIQGCFAQSNKGYIELNSRFAEGLRDVQGFSYLILFTIFSQKAAGYALLTKPFLDKDKKGIFAIRH